MIIQIETTKLAQCIWYFNGSEGSHALIQMNLFVKQLQQTKNTHLKRTI